MREFGRRGATGRPAPVEAIRPEQIETPTPPEIHYIRENVTPRPLRTSEKLYLIFVAFVLVMAFLWTVRMDGSGFSQHAILEGAALILPTILFLYRKARSWRRREDEQDPNCGFSP